MTNRLLKGLGFPNASHLGKRVTKKLLMENAPMTAADKRALKQDVETITWQFTLKPSSIPVKPYTDGDREYLEIAVLEVSMRNSRSCARLAEVIHRAIPYPTLIVFSLEHTCCLSVAPKRFSQAQKGAIISEEHLTTEWIDLIEPDPNCKAFLDSLALRELPHTHFLALYSAWVERFIAYFCSVHTGQFSVKPPGQEGYRQRSEALKKLERLQRRLNDIQSNINKKNNLGYLVQLNIKNKQIKDRIEAIKSKI